MHPLPAGARRGPGAREAGRGGPAAGAHLRAAGWGSAARTAWGPEGRSAPCAAGLGAHHPGPACHGSARLGSPSEGPGAGRGGAQRRAPLSPPTARARGAGPGLALPRGACAAERRRQKSVAVPRGSLALSGRGRPFPRAQRVRLRASPSPKPRGVLAPPWPPPLRRGAPRGAPGAVAGGRVFLRRAVSPPGNPSLRWPVCPEPSEARTGPARAGSGGGATDRRCLGTAGTSRRAGGT